MSSSDSPSLSPSSLPLPSLRTTPFCVLPPELTQLIIEHTIPPTLQTPTYSSRQSTLRSLCLVSKSFHHFARPLLFATLWIKRSSQDILWKGIHTNGDDKLLLREVIFDYIWEKPALNLDLVGYVGLRTLVVSNCGNGLEFSALTCVPQLAVLRLSGIAVSASAAFSLPYLYELGLYKIKSFDDQAQLLNPSSLPSLRLLAYRDYNTLLAGIDKVLALLLPQLHLISLEYCFVESFTPELLEKLVPITLFNADVHDLEETISVSYLRLDAIDFREDLDRIARRVQRARFSMPLTIYIPLHVSPDQPDSLKMTALRLICSSRGIEVVYENLLGRWYIDSEVSEHFMEKRKEARKKKETRVLE